MAKPTQSKSTSLPELRRLEKVLELMERHELAELEWEKGGEKIRLRAKSASVGELGVGSISAQLASYSSALTQLQAPAKAAPKATPPSEEKPAAAKSNQKQVVSPFVGTFYRSPSPEADPYVREGQSIKRGDALCIIEAMKLMNEIEAEFPGKLLSCLVENGQPVEFGEPLFLVEI